MQDFQKHKGSYIFLCVYMICILGYIGYVHYMTCTYGHYTIAVKVGISEGGKSGASSIYEYTFDGKKYRYHITDSGGGDSLIVMSIVPNSPSTCLQVQEFPLCILQMPVPKKGWKELPTCD